MTYYPLPAPARHFLHADWRYGFLVNSTQGSKSAADLGYDWGDFDLQCTEDLAVLNAHGNPEQTWPTPFWKHTRDFYAKQRHTYKGITYRLRSGAQTLYDNARFGVGTEGEVKRWECSHDEMVDIFRRLARAAERYYGPAWPSRFQIKVLTCLAGGETYALDVCRAAKEADPRYVTILLVRGKQRYKQYAGHTEITYIRGSAVVRRKRRKHK